MARSLLGGAPRRAVIALDPAGSYAVTYERQGADRGFAMGLLERPLTDDSFFTAISDAPQCGLDLKFEVRPLTAPDHPNTVEIDLLGTDGSGLSLTARSVGGGQVEITRVNGRAVLFDGAFYEWLADVPEARAGRAKTILARDGALVDTAQVSLEDGRAFLTGRRLASLAEDSRGEIAALGPSSGFWESAPIYFVPTSEPLFTSSAGIVNLAEASGSSLGELALAYEARLLHMSEDAVMAEMLRRYDIMTGSVERGLDLQFKGLQLMPASAGAIFLAEAEGRLSVRSLHARAAAVMHVDSAMGVVCAAPTGGSAGVIPGTMVTLAEERGLSRDDIALALLAAGAIGVIVAVRSTFAAEVAGCQVEIGAAGAMAAAAVIDACGGTARQACDAAAIALQNSMGSVCDLLHGTVEIPCHTRNAAAAASAFVCADLVLGGYPNLIPLDDTVDAVYAVGKMMPEELRCTSRGGLAVTPATRNLIPLG
jgi:L-serine dehydratase